MSYLEEQLRNVDDYGYPMPPTARRRLRKRAIRAGRSIIGRGIYLLMSCMGCLLWLSRRGQRFPPLTPATFHPRRILVIRLDLIGDLVLSLTAVRALKRTYPQAEIDLLAIPASAKVASFDPHLSEIITYDPNIWRRPRALLQLQNWRAALALLRRMHARHYDLAVSVYANWAAILAVASGARRRVGYGWEGYPGFMTDSVPGGIPGRWRHYAPLDNKHEVDYCLELARAAGATLTAADRIPHLYVDEQARQELEQLLNQAGVQPDRPLVVCHINSNNGQSKRWPIPYWALLIDRLIRGEGAQVVLTGAGTDIPQIQAVTRQMQEQALNLAGRTSLTQLSALLQRADLLISGDSGPLHMGVACGTPIIGMYGPTNPALGGPVSPAATVLRSPIWCSPCYNARDTADCRFYTTQCMKNILPGRVLEVARQKLAQKNAGSRVRAGSPTTLDGAPTGGEY
jgi:lipopolysaccharide heptosyltransferase II